MSWNRKRLVQHVATSTVATMHECISELADVSQSETQTGVDAELENVLANIAASEKQEELTRAQEMFQGLKPEDALKNKRQMARRASEANAVAAWITASIAGTSSGACEAYRKASSMRLSAATIEEELASLLKLANLSVLPCTTKSEGGKFVKQKASPAPAMALLKLRDARQAMRAFQIEQESAKALAIRLATANATLSALEGSRKTA